ncbi:MAG: sulfite exporter TauE/SafE family protein [Dehalococcoidales bacterium]
MVALDIFSVSWFLALGAVFFAAVVRGTTGFGFALVLAPVLLLLLEPKPVVVIALLLGLLSNIVIVATSLPNIRWRWIAPMLAGVVLGIPFGVLTISVISPSALRVMIGAVVLAFAIPLALGFTRVFRREKPVAGLAGFAGGFLASSTSLGGPPVVLFMHNQDWRKEAIHPSLAACFLLTTSGSLVGLLIAGLVRLPTVLTAASLAPALLVGTAVGIVAFRRINERVFRVLSVVIIFGAGIVAVLSGLGVIG